MESVLKKIKALKVEDWYYYYQKSENHFKNPFKEDIGHLDFIKKYFKRGGKAKVLQKFDVNNFLPKRAPHTNSVFFLGIYLYYNMAFKNYIDNSLTLKGYHMFPFIWFLITLFHDFGYKYEDEFDKFKHIVDIKTLKKELKIRYDLLRYKRIDGLSTVLYKNIENYFLYRRFNSKDHKKIDHGILAGLFFYDALVRNRISQYNNKKNSNELYFGRELNKVYAQAAGVIATHNIWFPTEENISEYEKFDLEKLSETPPISLNESPLLVLLGIVDTIDPVKIHSNDNKDKNINRKLKNILISCNRNELTLKKSSDCILDFNEIRKRSNGLDRWLDVKVHSSDECLCIKLNE
jgi:hypothetical protein